MCRFHLQGEIRSYSRSGPEHKQLWETCRNTNHMSIETNHTKSCKNFWNYLDCWPSGRFWVGFIVPADEQATIIFASLSSLASTPATLQQRQNIQLLGYIQCGNSSKAFWSDLSCILLINSGFSSVPEKIPKNANPRRRAMSHGVHSRISLYISTLIAPGGWPFKTIHTWTHH